MQFWKLTLTFALSRTKAATFVSRGWALVKGHGLHEAFTTRNFTVNLVGQIPQETDTVLHQLPEDLKKKKKGERHDQRWRQRKTAILLSWDFNGTTDKNLSSDWSEQVPYCPHLCGWSVIGRCTLANPPILCIPSAFAGPRYVLNSHSFWGEGKVKHIIAWFLLKIILSFSFLDFLCYSNINPLST